jgi:ferredoxin
MRIGIYYFSGTGNTRIVAGMFQKAFAEHEVDLIPIEDVRKKLIDANPGQYDLVGLGSPIHAWNAPRIVFEFIASLPEVNGIPLFYFKCPASIADFGGSTLPVRNALLAKGFRVVHEKAISMPSNFAAGWPEAKCHDAFRMALHKVKHIVQQIQDGQIVLQLNPFLLKLKTELGSMAETFGARKFGRHLKVKSSCTKCNLCVRACPMSNITRVNGALHFGNECIMCMRCIYSCPVNAIYPQYAKAVVLKDGYRPEMILKDMK